MKILPSIVLLLLVVTVWGVRPPISYCKSSPLPSMVPVSIGETVRLDLESLFDGNHISHVGYNLSFSTNYSSHITVLPKF